MEKLRGQVIDLKMKVIFSSGSTDINSTFIDHDDLNPIDDFPLEDIMLMEWELNKKEFKY